jgi:hypothetical protein
MVDRVGFVTREGRATTRSFRVDKSLNRELEAEAEKQGLSVSYILESLVDDYLNNHRWKNNSRAISILPQTLFQLLDNLEEETLAQIGFKTGSSVPKQGLLMRGGSLSDESVKQVFQILGEYDNWFTFSYHDTDPPYFFLRNMNSEKWIVFIEAYLRGLYSSILGKEITCKRVGDNLQIIL